MFIENLREDREEGVGLVNLEFKKEVKFWKISTGGIRIEMMFNL